jgi:hypothetical protein
VPTYLSDPIAPLQVKAMETAASLLGVKLLVHDIRTADDLQPAFDAGAKELAEGLITTAESIFIAERSRVTELAARYRLPAIYPFSVQTDAGGMMAYDIDYADLIRRAAAYVDKIPSAPARRSSGARFESRGQQRCVSLFLGQPAMIGADGALNWSHRTFRGRL